MRNTRRICSFVLIFFVGYSVLYAQNSSVHYPESADVRLDFIDSWFTQDISIVRDQSSEVFQNEMGEYFLIRAEEKDGLMEIIVSPLVVQTLDIQDFSLSEEKTNENTSGGIQRSISEMSIETWPKDGLGSWILYRNVETGKDVRLRYYISSEKDIFVEFFPGQDKSYANFSIFSSHVAHEVPVPVPFEYFYTASLTDVQKITKNILPWEYTQAYNNVYSETIQMVRTIRQYLPDAQRAKMFVSETSQFDFLKWIIDGLVRPLTGGILYEEPLFESTVEPNFTVPERQRTHKSYDYVRNLAAAALSADTSLRYTFDTSYADVKIEPFAIRTNEEGLQERVNFVTDIGYQVSLLKSILYVLTATEGDLFYLGAVREIEPPSNSGKNAEQYYYNNAVAFFSWFDNQGKFYISVFENGVEYTLEQFVERNPDSFVYLVRVKPSLNFFPEIPEIPESDTTLE